MQGVAFSATGMADAI